MNQDVFPEDDGPELPRWFANTLPLESVSQRTRSSRSQARPSRRRRSKASPPSKTLPPRVRRTEELNLEED